MLKQLRFKDLQAAGIVSNWASLKYFIDHYGFPSGRYLGANTRTWNEAEVQEWLDSRPTENSSALKGRAKASQRAGEDAA